MGALVLACGDEDGILRPEVVAASKFIDYGTWSDTTSVCMDDRLARLDRYIEETSSFLGIDPPAQRLSYVWVPEGQQHDDTWPCSNAGGCVRRGDAEYQSIAYVARDEVVFHELAHAVEIPAFGGSHWVFREGIAEYLSKPRSIRGATGGFPAEIAEMLARDQGSFHDYRLAMHFVGSLIERDGLEKYLEYRALVPFDGDLADFARAQVVRQGRGAPRSPSGSI
jgi:hypothetical protein